MVLFVEGEAMKRPQGDQAMRPMGPECPRQMHRSLIPGTGSSPTWSPSASSIIDGSPLGTNPAGLARGLLCLDLRFAMHVSVIF